MKKFYIFLIFLLVFGFTNISYSQISGNKTIGIGGDYSSLSAAISALNSQGIDGNVVFTVLNDLNEGMTSLIMGSETNGIIGNSTYSITFKAATPKTVMSSVPSGSAKVFITLNSLQNIVFEKLNFVAVNNFKLFALQGNLFSQNITFDSCQFSFSSSQHAYQYGIYAGSSYQTKNLIIKRSVFNYGNQAIWIDGTNNQNIKIDSCKFIGNSSVAYYNAITIGVTTNTTISNNNFNDYYTGITFINNGMFSNVEISDNTIKNMSRAVYLTSTTATSINFRILNNYMNGISSTGIYFGAIANTTTGNQIKNNTILGTTAGFLYGIDFPTAQSYLLINANKIYGQNITTSENFGIRFSNTLSYSEISNNTINAFQYGIRFYNTANYNVIKNCTIDNSAFPITTNNYGIFSAYAVTNSTFDGNTILFNPNSTASERFGINFTYTGAANNYDTIRNNIITNSLRAINLSGYISYSTIDKNNIKTSVISGDNYAIYLNTYSNTYGRNKITRNTIFSNYSSTSTNNYGIYINAPYLDTIVNNMITMQLNSSTAPTGYNYAIYTVSGSLCAIYHNSVLMRSTNALHQASACLRWTGSSHNVRNNIFNNQQAGYVIYTPTANSAHTCDYNIYFSNSANPFNLNGTTTNTTLSSWIGKVNGLALPSASDAHSDYRNPIFTSYSDLTPNTILIDNKAIPLTEVPKDINGEIRDLITPDPGAIEFDAPQGNGAKIIAIIPTSNCSSSQFTFQLQNIGTYLINDFDIILSNNGIILDTIHYEQAFNSGEIIATDILSDPYLMFWNNNISAEIYKINGDLPDVLSAACTYNYTLLLGGTYTIGNNGDFSSIASAVTAMNTVGICNDVVFNILNPLNEGTTQSILGTTASPYGIIGNNTLSSYSIKFTSDPLNPKTITTSVAAGTLAANIFFTMNGIKNITFENLNFVMTTAAKMFSLNGSATTYSTENVTFNNCTFSFPSVVSNQYAIYAAATNYTKNLTVTNSTFSNGYYNIRIEGTSTTPLPNTNMILDNNTFNATSSTNYGIYLTYPNNPVATNNKFTNSTYPIYMETATDPFINSNIISNASTGINMTGTTSYPDIQLNTMTGITNYGIYFSAIATNPIVQGNNITSSWGGIYFNSTANNSYVANNKLVNVPEYGGVYFYGANSNSIIEGNRIVGGIGCPYGICITGTATSVLIQNDTILNTSTAINIGSTATTCQIINNNISNATTFNATNGIYLGTNSSTNQIIGNDIYNISGTTANGIYVYGGSNNKIWNNNIRKVKSNTAGAYNSSTYSSVSAAICLAYYTTNGSNNSIANNTMDSIYATAIYISSYYQDKDTIRDNTITNNGYYLEGIKNVIWIQHYSTTANRTHFIKNNKILYDNVTNYGINGIALTNSSYSSYNSNSQSEIFNNIVRISGNQLYNTDNNISCLNIYSWGNNRIYNNTFVLESNNPAPNSTSIFISHYSTSYNYITNNTIKNNIIVNKAGGRLLYYPSTSDIAHDYNVYHHNALSNLFTINGTTYSSLAAVKELGLDVHSVDKDPIFMSASDLTPLSIAVDNLGTPLSEVTVDINYNSRDLITPDAGAIEFVAMTGTMAMLNSIAEDLQDCQIAKYVFNIKNIGTVDIDSIDIRVNVNGVIDTISYAINIPQGATITTPSSTEDFNIIPTNNITAKIIGINGAAPVIYTDSISYTHFAPMGGLYTIGSTGDFTTLENALIAVNSFGLCSNVTFEIIDNLNTNTTLHKLGNTVGNLGILGNDVYSIKFTSDVSDPKTITTSIATSNANNFFELNNMQNVSFENLNFTATYVHKLFVLQGTNTSHDITFDNCKFNFPTNVSNSYAYGIAALNNNASNLIVKKCNFTNGYYPIFVEGGNNSGIIIDSCTFNGASTSNYYNGVYLGATVNPQITNNSFTSFYYPIQFVTSATSPYIYNNSFTQNYSSIYTTVAVTNADIQENTFTTINNYAMYFGSSATNSIIKNNKITSSYYGINISGSANNSIIENDTISSISSGYAINLGSSANNTSIKNNKITTAPNGISIGSSANNSIIKNNELNGISSTYGIYVGSSSYDTISNNRITGTTSMYYGIYLSGTHDYPYIFGNKITTGSTYYSYCSGIYCSGAVSYGKFLNDTITGTNSGIYFNSTTGINLTPASTNEIANCKIENLLNYYALYFGGAAYYNNIHDNNISNISNSGIYFAGSTNYNIVDNNNINNINVSTAGTSGSSTVTSAQGAISFSSSIGNYNQVTNNTIENCYSTAIFMNSQNSDVVANNIITNNGSYYNGIKNVIWFSNYSSYNNNLHTITGNQILYENVDGSGCNGIAFTGSNTYYNYNDNCLLANNIVKISGNALLNSDNSTCIALYNHGGIKIYHNTLILESYTPAILSFNLKIDGYSTTYSKDNIIKNNIIINKSFGRLISYPNVSGTLSDYNIYDYSAPAAGLFTLGGTQYNNLTAAQNKINGNDEHSIKADPMFVSANNFTPQSSIIDNLGEALSEVTTDIYGDPRDIDTPDPGAIEFTSIFPDFEADNLTSCVGTTINFADLSIGNVNSWEWNFGDGTISTLQNPSHIYSNFGTYNVSLTVNNGPVEIKNSYITINSNPTPTITNNTASNELNCSYPLISLTANALGCSYEWSNGSTNQTVNITTADTYTVVATNDITGCTAISPAFVITQGPAAPTISINSSSQTNILNCLEPPITLTAVVTNAGANPNYEWNNGLGSGLSKTISQSGTYEVTLTNGLGCTVSDFIIITADSTAPVVSFTYSNTEINCNTSTNVSITAASTLTVTYLWSNSLGNNASVTVSNPGIYNVTATAANGCETIEQTINIADNTAPPTSVTITSNNGTELNCSVSLITLTANGGDSYVWSNGLGTNQTANIINPDNYKVTATNASNGCTAESNPFQITSDPTLPSVYIIPPITDVLTCSTPFIELTAVGSGIGTYEWNTGDLTENITISQSGTYELTFTNTLDCETITSIFIDEDLTAPTSVTITSNNGTELNCAVSSISLTANGGDSYEWSNGASGQTVNITTAGLYTVVATNASTGCTTESDTPFEITVDPLVATVSITSSSITNILTCLSPSIILTAEGSGIGNYEWSTGDITEDITVSQLGTYVVTFTDNLACETIASITINEDFTVPAPVTITSNNGMELNCAVSAITLTANGGDSYVWSNGSAANQIVVTVSDIYQVTATNANSGCTAESTQVSISLDPSLPPSVSITSTSSTNILTCATPPITLTAAGSGLGNFLWTNGEATQSITISQSGTYEVTFTNALGCEATDYITIYADSVQPVVLLNYSNNEINCYGGVVVTASALGAVSYQWSNGLGNNATSAIINIPGTYQVTVIAANGCQTIEETNYISQNTTAPLPTITNNSNSNELNCVNPSISLTANGGDSYNWSNSLGINPTVNIINSGTYTVTATSLANGCTAEVYPAIVILQNLNLPTVSISSSSITNILTCTTPSINLTAVGLGTFEWSNEETTAGITVSSAGNYFVTLTDAIGCTVSDFIFIGEDLTAPVVNISYPTTEINCSNNMIILTASGANSYQWSNGLGTNSYAYIIAGGTYTVTGTGTNGCTAAATTPLIIENTTAPSAEIINNTGTNELSCSYPSISLTAIGNGSYLWNYSMGTNATITVNLAVTYIVTVTGSNGCTNTASLQITESSAFPQLTITPNPNTTVLTCNITQIQLLASANLEGIFNWGGIYGETSHIMISEAGTYSVTFTDEGGCAVNKSITITKEQNPLINLNNEYTSCNETFTLPTPSGYPNFTWYNYNNQQITNPISEEGNYKIVVTDDNNCSSSLVVFVHFGTIPVIDTILTTMPSNATAIDGALSVICSNPNVDYLWNIGSTNSSLTGLGIGEYCVTVTNLDGCSVDKCIILNYITGIDEHLSNYDFIVYPNPNIGEFTIDLQNITNAENLQIIDILGNIVSIIPINTIKQNISVNLANGSYFVKVICKDKMLMKQIIISR